MKTIVGQATAAFLLTAFLSSLPHHHVQAVVVGDEVCITGYIMDNYCLFETRKTGNENTLLDRGDIITLQYPEEHSFHCLLDVGVCRDSGFQVLGDKDPATDRHCLGFRLDDADKVVDAGRALGEDGYCYTCESDEDDAPEYGYRATVRGIVDELGDGSQSDTGPPLLTNIELLDASVVCENPTIPPMCVRASDEVEPEPSPSPTKEPTNEPTTAAPTETTRAPVGPPLDCPDTLDKSTEIDSLSTFYYAMVPSDPPGSGNGILCGRIVAENDGWVGLAISRDGAMTGSEAIIFNPADGSILKYDLNARALSGVIPMSDDKQTLRDTGVSQIAGGTTTVAFTKLLVEDGEIPIVEEGENIFLHARGGSALGYHSNGRVMFNIDFSASPAITNAPSTSPVIAPSASPTMDPITLSPSLSPAKSQTGSPVSQPSASPQAEPSANPTKPPLQMTNSPTGSPTASSTAAKTLDPIKEPTVPPTDLPNVVPSVSPILPLATSNPSSDAQTDGVSSSPATNLTTSPEGMSSASPSMKPVTISPTMKPVSNEIVSETTEPPFSSGSATTIWTGLTNLFFAGASLALLEIIL